MKNTLLGALAFLLCAAAPGLALSMLAMASAPVAVQRPDPTGDFLMVLIYSGSTAGLRTVGFAIPTGLSAAWRGSPAMRVAIIAGTLGVTSPITSMLVLAAIAKAVLPLFHSAPWLATALLNGVPGLVLGLFAFGIARLWPVAKPK
jgi:hypothetical protein